MPIVPFLLMFIFFPSIILVGIPHRIFMICVQESMILIPKGRYGNHVSLKLIDMTMIHWFACPNQLAYCPSFVCRAEHLASSWRARRSALIVLVLIRLGCPQSVVTLHIYRVGWSVSFRSRNPNKFHIKIQLLTWIGRFGPVWPVSKPIWPSWTGLTGQTGVQIFRGA